MFVESVNFGYIRELLHPNIEMNPRHRYSISVGTWNDKYGRQERELENKTTGQKYVVYSDSCSVGSYVLLDLT